MSFPKATATVFLDRDLRVTYATPAACALFHSDPPAVGRAWRSLSRRSTHRPLKEDAMRALRVGRSVEREWKFDGRWFLACTVHERASDGHPARVSMTFVETTDARRIETDLRRTRGALEAARRELGGEAEERGRAETTRQELLRQLLTAQEQERSRISRGLHDEVGQQLTAIILEIKAMETRTSPHLRLSRLRAIRAIAERLAREIHDLAVELRPTALDDLGLLRALSNFLEGWSTRTQIKVTFVHAGLSGRRLPGPVETTLYRIVCEALNNVLKHAKTKRVQIALERRDNEVRAGIKDEGVGFNPTAPDAPKKLGIVGMKERAALLGGDIQVVSRLGHGSTVTVRLPLDTKAEG